MWGSMLCYFKNDILLFYGVDMHYLGNLWRFFLLLLLSSRLFGGL